MISKSQKYVIGIDGGGTKTEAVLTNLEGKILSYSKTGPSNIQKIGLKPAIKNILQALNQVSQKYPKDKIVFIYIGLAGGLERDEKKKKEIKIELLKSQSTKWIKSKKLLIDDDLLIAFRSGTEKKQGVVLIAGTGSIVAGWNNKNEKIIGGWDYLLGDVGSGFWIGKKGLQAAIVDKIEGLGQPKTDLSKIILRKLKIKTEADLMRKIYQPKAIETIASLAPLVDIAAQKRDKVSKQILITAGNELVIRTKIIIKKLNLKEKTFPLVLVGGVFKSKIILTLIKKKIKSFAPKVDFILPKEKPVIGAIKLAIEFHLFQGQRKKI